MNNKIWFVLICLVAFLIGYSMNNLAISVPKYRVAVIDVTSLLENSSEMKTLNLEHAKQTQELNTLISKAQNELLNEHDKAKLLQKEALYRSQIEKKKQEIDNNYNSKLETISNNIKNTINSEAQKADYNLVLPTGMVIAGGEDITSSVLKKIK